MTTITPERHQSMLKICAKGKHKLRENSFGVVFCVRCGLLSTSVGIVPKILEEDKLLIK